MRRLPYLKCVNTKWYEFGVGLSVYQLIADGGVFWETVWKVINFSILFSDTSGTDIKQFTFKIDQLITWT